MTAAPIHALSVDVEDLACGLLLRACNRVAPPSHDVVEATRRMLRLIDEHGIKATWFVLGEVAQSYPALVRELSAGGHEIGVHGWHHHRVFDLDPNTYRESLRNSRSLLQGLSGQEVLGYRAVEFSITSRTLWAYEILAELGFGYSSSVFPIGGRRYGIPDAPLRPYPVEAGGRQLIEVPMTAVKVGPVRVPVLGGGYLRHFPLVYSKLALLKLKTQGRPGLMYLHPHELGTSVCPATFPIEISDEERARISEVSRTYFRNMDKTERKLRWIFSRYDFAPVRDVFLSEGETCGSAALRNLRG